MPQLSTPAGEPVTPETKALCCTLRTHFKVLLVLSALRVLGDIVEASLSHPLAFIGAFFGAVFLWLLWKTYKSPTDEPVRLLFANISIWLVRIFIFVAIAGFVLGVSGVIGDDEDEDEEEDDDSETLLYVMFFVSLAFLTYYHFVLDTWREMLRVMRGGMAPQPVPVHSV